MPSFVEEDTDSRPALKCSADSAPSGCWDGSGRFASAANGPIASFRG
jgi:hypothetical protein